MLVSKPLLKGFEVILRVTQIVIILIALIIGFFHVKSLGEESVLNILQLSDPYLVLLDPSNDLLNSQNDIQIQILDQSYKSAKLSIREVSVLLPINTSYAVILFSLFFLHVFLVILGVEQLRLMVRSSIDNTPFSMANVKRISLLSYLFLGYPFLRFLGRWSISSYLEGKLKFVGLKWVNNFEFDLTWFLMGILLLTIGKIFEYGIKLQEEQDLTI